MIDRRMSNRGPRLTASMRKRNCKISVRIVTRISLHQRIPSSLVRLLNRLRRPDLDLRRFFFRLRSDPVNVEIILDNNLFSRVNSTSMTNRTRSQVSTFAYNSALPSAYNIINIRYRNSTTTRQTRIRLMVVDRNVILTWT